MKLYEKEFNDDYLTQRDVILLWLEFAHGVATQPHNLRVTAYNEDSDNTYIVHLLFNYDDKKYYIKFDLIGGIGGRQNVEVNNYRHAKW